MAKNILESFPLNAVGRIKRLQVEDSLSEFNKGEAQAKELVATLKLQIAQLPVAQSETLHRVVAEIEDSLNADTLSRLSDYVRLGKSRRFHSIIASLWG